MLIIRSRPSQYGFTLIELLVSVFILTIGILGVAGLQSTGWRLAQDSGSMSAAAMLVSSMADRMRTNVKPSTDADAYSITGSESNPGCISTGCTYAQQAAFDGWSWNQEIDEILNNATGTVSLTGSIHTITIEWNESADSGDTTDQIQAVSIDVVL